MFFWDDFLAFAFAFIACFLLLMLMFVLFLWRGNRCARAALGVEMRVGLPQVPTYLGNYELGNTPLALLSY